MTIELIPYEEFAMLRLSQYLTVWKRLSIRKLHNWEFLGKIWLGEAIGFTEFVRLETMPNELGSISIDLKGLPNKSANAILQAIHFPLKPYASREDVEACLGEPKNILLFTPDRETLEFSLGKAWPYYVSCTVHHKEGLIYVVVARKDILEKTISKEVR